MPQIKSPRKDIATPVGVASLCWLHTPNKMWVKDGGVYQTDVVCDPDDPAFVAFKKELEEFGKDARKALMLTPETEIRYPIKPHKDREKNETGQVAIKTKVYALRKVGGGPPIRETVTVVDTSQPPKKVSPTPAIGAGSKIRVACSATAKFFPEKTRDDGSVDKEHLQISLYIQGVQLVELVQFGEFSPDRFGFGEIEDGFRVDDVEESPKQPGDEEHGPVGQEVPF